jgi:hypothetical protein
MGMMNLYSVMPVVGAERIVRFLCLFVCLFVVAVGGCAWFRCRTCECFLRRFFHTRTSQYNNPQLPTPFPPSTPTKQPQKKVFYRERAASMYNPLAYGLALAVVELPFLAAQALLFAPAVYFAAKFTATAGQVLYFVVAFWLSVTYYTIFGEWLVYFTPTQQLAQTFGSNANFAFSLVNGFVQPYPAIPVRCLCKGSGLCCGGSEAQQRETRPPFTPTPLPR